MDDTHTPFINSILVALLVTVFSFLYVSLFDHVFNVASWSKIVAGTAGVLFACSFSISTVEYYFDSFKVHMLYRKYLGLLGYFLALGYSLMLLLLVNPERYLYGFFDNVWSADIILGLAAMTILTLIALVSNGTAMNLLGMDLWRNILRLGYLAYFLLALRALLIEGPLWREWLAGESTILPPGRLVLFVIALTVIITHYSTYLDKWRKRATSEVPTRI